MKYIFAAIIPVLLLISCEGKKSEMAADPDIYYTCSMDPQVKENKPGKCPICKMELTPARKSSKKDVDEIELSAQQIQLGNIQVDTIHNMPLGDQVTLPATLNFDQSKTNAVSARVMGRIEKLYFKNKGDYVSKGTKLFDLYSEELNNAKQEYLLTLEKQKALDNTIIDFSQLAERAKSKLILWGMSESQIQELVKTKSASTLTSFYSNAMGYITSLDVKEGDYVTEGGSVVHLADLSSLWAEAQVYASQLSAIKVNSPAIVQFPDMQGKQVNGKIEFANPEITPDTRINLVRITIPNTGNQLKPGMAAYVTIKSRQITSLSLPANAVIKGSRGATVWIKTGFGKFRYQMVELGQQNNRIVEIKSGLQSGNVVVINGAYLLNSEYIFKHGKDPMEGMSVSKMKM